MNNKTTTYILVGALIILLLGLGISIGKNAKNKKNLNAEKLTSEKLFSEKSALDKELTRIKTDYASLNKKSEANARLLDETNAKIAENEKRINTLSADNRSMRSNKTELAYARSKNDELSKELSQLKSDKESLIAQSNNLQNSINSLEAEKKKLNDQLEKAKLYNTDNFLVTATRGKKTEKLVIRASRTKKLNMAFEVPQSLTDAISFKIVTPTGSTINPDNKGMSWYFPMDSRNFTASLSSATGEFEQSRQVVLNYAAKEKLVKGEYKIQILSNGINIGNCRVMLK